MFIDIFASLFASFSVASGYRKGMFSQLLNLLILAGSFVLTKLTHHELTPYIADFTGLGPTTAPPAAFLVTWLLCYFVLGFFADGLMKRWRRTRPASGGADRLLGASFGLLKAAIAIYLILAVTMVAKNLVFKAAPGIKGQLQKSYLAHLVDEHNVLDSEGSAGLGSPRLRTMGKLLRLANDPELPSRIRNDPATRKNAERLMNLIRERKPELAERLQSGDISSLAHDTELLDLVEDPKILEAIESFPE